MLDTVLDDLRNALRSLIRNPLVSLATVAIVGVGIGLVTAFFSVANGFLFRPLPYGEPDRLHAVAEERPREYTGFSEVSPEGLRLLREEASTLVGAAAYERTSFNLAGGGAETAWTSGGRVTPDLFRLLGVEPVLGRSFGPDDVGRDVAVLEHGLWQSAFGGDPGVVSRTIRLDGRPHEVVGVMPERFGVGRNQKIWTPLDAGTLESSEGDDRALSVLVRRVPGVEAEAVRSELRSLSTRLAGITGEEGTLVLREEGAERASFFGPLLWLFFVPALLLLVVTCSNAAGLLLARQARRRSEMAVRASLGAGRGRLFRQGMVEGSLLALAAAILGLGVAHAGARLFVSSLPAELPWFADLAAVDGRMLVFVATVAVLTVLLVSLTPSLAGARVDLRGVLAGGQGATASPRQRRSRKVALVVQLALTFVLAVSGALVWRSAANVEAMDPGYDPERVVTALVRFSELDYPTETEKGLYRERLTGVLDRVQSVAGVAWRADVAHLAPDLGGLPEEPLEGVLYAEGRAEPYHRPRLTVVEGPYFRTLGVEILRGETLPEGEASASVVVGRTLAVRLWPDLEALGRSIRIGGADAPEFRVVGVVEDVYRLRGGRGGMRRETVPALYLSGGHAVGRNHELVVRSSRAADVKGAVRRAGAAVDPDVPLGRLQTRAEELAIAGLPQRIVGRLFGIFAGLGLGLALAGLYGLVAYDVALRTREIGIRTALGADRATVVRFLMKDGGRLTAWGIAVGAGLSVVASLALRILLYDVSPLSPWVHGGAALLFGTAAALAILVPARRALGVDPAEALRTE